MEQGLGWLRWSPEQFWGATLAELTAGACGFLEAKTGKSPRAEAQSWADAYAEVLAARRAERDASD